MSYTERPHQACQREDPHQTGRIAAYHFFIRFLLRPGRDPFFQTDTIHPLKKVIRQALAGDLLCLNQTALRENGQVDYRGIVTQEPLGPDLGGFGEGLKQGLEEILALILEKYPEKPE